LVGYFAWVVVSDRAQIGRALLRFQGAKLRWLLVAIGCGVVSQVAGVLVQHRILARAGVAMRVRSTFAFVLAQSAIGLAAPGGPVAANVYAFRRLRKRGTEAAVAGWALAAINIFGAIAVAGFSIFALTGVSPAGIATLVVLALLLGGLVIIVRSPSRARRPMMAISRTVRRARRRPTDDVGESADAFVKRLSVIRLRHVDLSLTGALAVLSVVADCAVWLAATQAMITVPSRCQAVPPSQPLSVVCSRFHEPKQADDLVAYASGQAANAIPFLPGGLGLVESAMTATLTARHVRPVPALSAVLLYRVISYWAVILIGGACWLALRRKPPVLQRRAAPL
jgi:uncharacterized membrane protein YbhN (UPF0104 family)